MIAGVSRGDGFSEAPAVPAAIDEVAEMTFRWIATKGAGEEAAKNFRTICH